MKIHRTLIIIAVVAITATGYAQDKKVKWYVGGALGYAGLMDSDWTWGSDSGTVSWDASIAYSLAVGAEFASISARAELELFGQNHDEDGEDPAEVGLTAFMVNGYYDFQNESPVTPYLLAGVGFAQYRLKPNSAYSEGSTGVGAFQIGGGIGYAVAEKWTIDLKYKYFMTSDPTIEVSGESDIDVEASGHQALLGVRYTF